MGTTRWCGQWMTAGDLHFSRGSRHVNIRYVLMATSVATASLVLAAPAAATQYPVSGTVTFNGNSGNLPDGSTFGDSSYDTGTGLLSSGKFTFPQSTVTDQTDFGPLVVTYQLSQTNTVDALVGSDGITVFGPADLKLHVVSVTLSGFPIDVGTTCSFEPIVLDALGGTASSEGIIVAQMNFIIPQTQDECGGYNGQLNDAIATSTGNSISLTLEGDFTPPDVIFRNGFDGP